MIKHILVACDGSESADQAFALALDLAGRYGADLQVLAVAGPGEDEAETEDASVIESSQAAFRHVLEPLRERAAAAGISARFDVAIGSPAEQIVHWAEQRQVELIVVGHPGRGLFSRLILGSVAKQVIDHAHCAVLVSR